MQNGPDEVICSSPEGQAHRHAQAYSASRLPDWDQAGQFAELTGDVIRLFNLVQSRGAGCCETATFRAVRIGGPVLVGGNVSRVRRCKLRPVSALSYAGSRSDDFGEPSRVELTAEVRPRTAARRALQGFRAVVNTLFQIRNLTLQTLGSQRGGVATKAGIAKARKCESTTGSKLNYVTIVAFSHFRVFVIQQRAQHSRSLNVCSSRD